MPRRLPSPIYDPSTDSTLAIWLDASDSSTNSLLDTTATSISNGETIGTWKSKKGTARSFTQWGTRTRPTWDSVGINGLGAARFVSPSIITTQTTMTDFASMSGATAMVVSKLGTNSFTNDGCFAFTMQDQSTGFSDISMIYIATRNDEFRAGGRRTRGDSFQEQTSTNAITSPLITTAVYDYSSAKLSLYGNGIRKAIGATFQTSGTTHASEPFAISIGGFAQQTSSAVGLPFDGWVGEVLFWKSAMAADQLLPMHDYLRRKWSIL